MILGVCGKISSGKSEAIKILKKYGFYCIDADKITHQIYKPKQEGSNKIKEVFGKEFLKKSGEVNRNKLRNFVFSDLKALKLLNKTIHPIIDKKVKILINRVSNNKNIAIESAYFEKNCLEKYVDKILWIQRNKKKIIEFLIKNRSFTNDMANISYSIIKKPKKTSFIIINNDNLKDLGKKITHILNL